MLIYPQEDVRWFKRGQCVYFIQCLEYTKIGCSADVEKRLLGLYCDNPYPMRVLALIYTRKNGYLEGYLHRMFEAKRHRNEWFELDFLTDIVPLEHNDIILRDYIRM
jgi:hypothetical protein